MKFRILWKLFCLWRKESKGLRLTFEIDKEKQTLKTTFIASPTFQGWDGIVHGGIISTLLDEAMAKLIYELGYQAVTASLEIKFKKPAPILEPLRVYGQIAEVSKRLIRAKAHVAKEDGTILATGTSTFLKQSQNEYKSNVKFINDDSPMPKHFFISNGFCHLSFRLHLNFDFEI